MTTSSGKRLIGTQRYSYSDGYCIGVPRYTFLKSMQADFELLVETTSFTTSFLVAMPEVRVDLSSG